MRLQRWPVLFFIAAVSTTLAFPAPSLGTSPVWTVEGGQARVELGRTVSRAGDVNGDGYDDVIVSIPRYQNKGRVTVHHGSPAGLSTAPNWLADGETVNDEFGWSIAAAGDVNGDGYDDIIIGAPFHSIRNGKVYLYHGSPSGLSLSPDWTGECNFAPGIQFGRAVGAAGDVNGDGYADVVVGTPGYRYVGYSEQGAGFVYLGSPSGLSTEPATTIEGPWLPIMSYLGFGGSVGTAGDTNGDGFSEIFIAASEFDDGLTNRGKIYVYPGSAAGIDITPSWTVEGDQQYEGLGISTAAADLNGDGYSDLIVGAPFYDGATVNEGLVQVFYGSLGGLSPIPGWLALGGAESLWFGISVNSAGDVDGDGYEDLVTGVPNWVVNQRNVGAIRVALGSPAGLAPGLPALIRTGPINGSDSGASFGESVAGAGDVNADGFADIIVGARYFTNDASALENVGKAFLYIGLPSGIDRDGDGRGPDAGDCDDRNALKFSRPREAANLIFLDAETLTWDAQSLPDGTAVTFDIIRSASAADFVSLATCIERNDGADRVAIDAAAPPPGAIYHYLVRAENGCRGSMAMGSLGSTSMGGPRVGLVCR